QLNTIAAQTQEYLINDDVVKISSIRNIEEELVKLQDIEPPDKLSLRSQELLSPRMFEIPVLEKLDSILVKLIAKIPEVKAATIVSIEGEVLATELPKEVDGETIAVMTAALLSLAESAITLIRSGEFEQLFIRGRVGYLLVIPAGYNAVLSVSTSRNVKLGSIYHDCKQVSEEIAKVIDF
ncbi:MAG: roadblock/LC7 domain-containing protein, partial [Promethearchaeota archaeon]